MKCPKCNYQNGYDPKSFVNKEGDQGDFEIVDHNNEDMIVECPQCKNQFIPD